MMSLTDPASEQSAPLEEIIVVGAFRSGTNLMKWLLESNFHVQCSFNRWWWKHCLPPTLVAPGQHLRPAAPLLIMVKEPVRHNVSLFSHWKRTRPGLLGEQDFSQFIRSELIVHDNSYGGKGPKYLFPTPTDYWNAFYFSYTHWDDIAPASELVRLDQLESQAADILRRVAAKFSLQPRATFSPQIPTNKVRPSPDGRSALVDPALTQNDSFEVSAADRDFIASRVSRRVADRLFRS